MDELNVGPALGEKAPDPAVVLMNHGEHSLTRLRHLIGDGFTGLAFVQDKQQAETWIEDLQEFLLSFPFTMIIALPPDTTSISELDAFPVTLIEDHGEATAAFGEGETFYLLRPDRHIAAKLRHVDKGKLSRMFDRLRSQYSLVAELP